MKRKVIIDTDPGHDDAMALMLAVKSEMFDVLAITTVCGNSTISNTTRNTRYIMNLLDKRQVPIYSGAKKPIKRKLIKAVVHGKSGLVGIDPKNRPQLTNNASLKIIELVRDNPGVTIITLGPLTNIAQAILMDPEAMSKVGEIVSMAGAINVAGNKNRVAEFNVFVDPEAADIVFRFTSKQTIVPLDPCNDISLELSDFKLIKNRKLRLDLLKMVKPYIQNISLDEGVKVALMYDPLTIFYVLYPEYCRSEVLNVVVETKGQFTRGMTVIDRRVNKDKIGTDIKIVTEINGKYFIKTFIEMLSKE